MSQKRKRVCPPALTATRKKRRVIPSTPLRFLDFPRELRDEIYDLVIAQEEIWEVQVQPTGSGKNNIIGVHGLFDTCRQTRREFSDQLKEYPVSEPTSVLADVVDFNFYALETYLKRVIKAEGDLRAFDHEIDPNDDTRRQLIVALTVTRDWCRNPDAKHIARWFKFLDKLLAQGYVDEDQYFVTYRFKLVEDREATKTVVRRLASGNKGSARWAQVLKDFNTWYGNGTGKSGRKLEDAKKSQRWLDEGKLVGREDVYHVYEDQLSDWEDEGAVDNDDDDGGEEDEVGEDDG